MTLPDNWDSSQNILVILAHPDDPEFFCGGTLAKWARAGHHITYQLLTCGDKGFNESTPEGMTPDALCAIRHEEQLAAAKVIGAEAVHFMDCPDGYLVPTIDLRRDLVRVIRKFKPDILVTCDPQTLFAIYGINHPDHRAAGEATLAAVFPAARDRMNFPELLAEGLEPHKVREIYLAGAQSPDVAIDVTAYLERKLESLRAHVSQIGDWDPEPMVREWAQETAQQHPGNGDYVESFKYFKLD